MTGRTDGRGARVLYTADEIGSTVGRLGAEIAAARPDGVLLASVLKGSVFFLADLCRVLPVPVEIDFLAITTFGGQSGRVRLLKDLDADIGGRHVVIVEDIVDTGLTVSYLAEQLRARGPASVEVCTLLDRRARRIVPVEPRFVGWDAPDEFFIGYGLDFRGRYRNLSTIAAGDESALADDPDTHVAELYGAPTPSTVRSSGGGE